MGFRLAKNRMEKKIAVWLWQSSEWRIELLGTAGVWEKGLRIKKVNMNRVN